MFKVIDKTNDDNSQLTDMIGDLVPYCQKRTQFDQPVDIMLLTDLENAQNPLGRTAYYDPDSHMVALYITNRHIKDILRSLSHELVHHAQNCRGEFDNLNGVQEGYAQNDEHLREMEMEAYLEGNLILRDWENGIKETSYQEDLFETLLRRFQIRKT